jgi:hypothetical protein
MLPLMLIQMLAIYTAWVWTALSKFWSCILPPSSRSKCVWSESGSFYDWWFIANQFVLAPSPMRLTKFFHLNRCGNNDEWMVFALTNRLRFAIGNCTYRAYSILLKFFLLHYIHKPSLSPGFAKQIMSSLLILCYNGSLVTWTVVWLTAAKFKPLIFSTSGFASSYTANEGVWWARSCVCVYMFISVKSQWGKEEFLLAFWFTPWYFKRSAPWVDRRSSV